MPAWNRESQSTWRKVGIVAAFLSLALLLIEHFIPHGIDLDPVNHWLSEYVLSHSVAAIWLMKAAFLSLAVSALAVAMIAPDRRGRLLFLVASFGLAVMPILDTNPNDGLSQGMKWPPTPGNLHQLALYLAIGAALLGMGLSRARGARRMRPSFLFGVAILATAAQTGLVAASHAVHQATRFGGVTERTIVVAMLCWVIATCVSPSSSQSDLA